MWLWLHENSEYESIEQIIKATGVNYKRLDHASQLITELVNNYSTNKEDVKLILPMIATGQVMITVPEQWSGKPTQHIRVTQQEPQGSYSYGPSFLDAYFPETVPQTAIITDKVLLNFDMRRIVGLNERAKYHNQLSDSMPSMVQHFRTWNLGHQEEQDRLYAFLNCQYYSKTQGFLPK